MADFEVNRRLKSLIENHFCMTPFAFSRKYNDKGGVKTSQVLRERNGLSSKLLDLILEAYPEINKAWLLTGEGEMLKKDQPSKYSINQKHNGVPYYDVDFIGGFDLVSNDQTTIPTYHIDFAEYNKADCWVNITGHSMEPAIHNGDIVALRELQDWNTYLLYGEIYAIVTDEYRTVKRIRKSSKGDDFILIIPINKDYDEQDIPRKVIRKIYQVLGAAKKLF